MANRDRLYERDAGLFIVTPCTPQVIAGGLMATLAVLWTAAISPPLRVAAPSAGWAVDAVLMVALIAVATMLVAAIGLVTSDWLAELKHRNAYAASGVASDDLITPPVVQASNQLYPPAVDNEALWAVLRANRHALRSIALKTVSDMWCADVKVATWTQVRKNALPTTSASVVGTIPEDERTSAVGGSVAGVAASGRVAAAAKRDAQEALRVRVAIGLTAIRSTPWRRNGMGVNRSVYRTQLVANDEPWLASRGPDQRLALHTVPNRIISDIIILGQGKRRPPGGEPPPSTPGANVPGTGVSMRTGVVASTAQDRRQHPSAASKRLHPEVSFEAQRQLIALAEALARQAAREDDATEHLTERSRSPPDVAGEIGQGVSGREDTS
jgi:hypothetical protein